MDSFADILNRTSGDAVRPRALPVGTYLTIVDGPYRTNKVGQDQTETCEFNLKVLSVIQAQDDAEIAAFDGGVAGQIIYARFFMTEKALYRLDDFLEILNIPKGMPYKQALAECPNRQVVVNLTQRPSPQGDRMFNEIKGYARP